MKAWLVLWEWAGEHAAVEDEIVAVLRPRMSGSEVGKTLELIYKLSRSSVSEMARYAKHPREFPYPVRSSGFPIHCGHNPWLVAYPVEKLKIDTDTATGFETISWTMPTLYRWNRETEQRELVRGPMKRQVTRSIVGPLSHRLMN